MASQPPIGPSLKTIPDGDDRERLVCGDCGYIAYENPKIVVGAVCIWQDQILMCKRAIEPRVGTWTIPAGYMEMGETTAEGAAREVLEEAGALIEVTGLLGVFEIPRISQIYVVHRADMTGPQIFAGTESEAVKLVAWADIPWDELSFPSITWALRQFEEKVGPAHVVHGSEKKTGR
jgi:ADP-ribose pyrophosphatase YjhB (NUDIX family)